jgi:hypothetical protein
MRAWLVLILAVVAVSLGAASPAMAGTLTARGESSVPDVTDLLYAGGTTTTRPVPQNPTVVDGWRAEELRTYGQNGSGPSLQSELEKFRRGARVKWGLRILGRATLVSTAGQVGFEVGSILADEIYEDELPAKPALLGWDQSFAEVFAVQKGDCIQFAGWPWGPPSRQGLTDAQAYGNCSTGTTISGGTAWPGTIRAPEDGWVLSFREAGGARNYFTVQWGPGPEGDLASRLKPGYSLSSVSGCDQIRYPLAGAALEGFRLIGATTASGAPWFPSEFDSWTCSRNAVDPPIITTRPYVWFKPASGTARPPGVGEDAPYGPVEGGVPDPGRTSVEATVRDQLCTAAYRRAASFIAGQLGEAVCEGQVQIPSCRGRSVDACIADLQARGITNYRVEDAPVEEADPEVAPGDALGTEPPADSWIDSGEQVEIRRNPQPPIIDTADDEPRDERCETATRSDPAPGGIGMFELVTEAPPYWTAENPDGGELSIPLHYGNPYPTSDQQSGWGFRHIKRKHGWDDGVASRTSDALMRRPSPSGGQAGGRRESDDSLTYWHQFVHPQTNEQCTQIVRARDRPKPGDDETLGILTSYASHGWNVPQPK